MAWPEKLPSGKWCGRYRDAYGNSRSAGTFSHKAAAVRAANAKEAEVRKSLTKNPDAHKQTWGEWCEKKWWPSRTVEPGTVKRDASRRDQHLMPRWRDVPLGQITRHDVKAWAADLRAGKAPDGSERKPLANSSVQRVVHLFSASLVAAIDAEVLVTNPAARLRLPPSDATKDRFLEHDEYDAIVDNLPDADQLVMHVLTYSGLRIGELSALQWRRVDLVSGQIVVAASFDDETGEFKAYPKGRKARVVPIDAWLCELLSAHREDIDGKPRTLVFARPDGSPLRRSNWDNTFRRAVGLTNLGTDEQYIPVEPVSIHDLRHTFCSWLVQAGVSLAKVGKLAGHESPMTTQRYAHLQPTNQDEIHTALGRPGGVAPRLPHGEPGTGALEQRVARSELVGPVGIEPTTRGLKESHEPRSALEPDVAEPPLTQVRTGVRWETA